MSEAFSLPPLRLGKPFTFWCLNLADFRSKVFPPASRVSSLPFRRCGSQSHWASERESRPTSNSRFSCPPSSACSLSSSAIAAGRILWLSTSVSFRLLPWCNRPFFCGIVAQSVESDDVLWNAIPMNDACWLPTGWFGRSVKLPWRGGIWTVW